VNEIHYFLSRIFVGKCTKTHLQQYRIQKFFRGNTPDPRLKGGEGKIKEGSGRKGGERGGTGRDGGERRGREARR
jgi:hypothetical protein